MALIPIAMPRIIAGSMSGNSPVMQQPPVLEANTQDWLENTLVQITGTGASVRLQRAAAAATLLYGLAPQAAIGSASPDIMAQPPQSLFGRNHYPQNLRGVLLEISITNGSLSGANIGATGVTWAGGGTGGVALAPGQRYGLLTMTSGTYNKYQTLDVTNTTQQLFEIVQLAPYFSGVAQTVNDNNPRVWVKLIDSVLQA